MFIKVAVRAANENSYIIILLRNEQQKVSVNHFPTRY